MVTFVKIWPQIASINLSNCSATMCLHLCLRAGVQGQLNIIIRLDMWWHDASDAPLVMDHVIVTLTHFVIMTHVSLLSWNNDYILIHTPPFDRVTKMFFKTSQIYLMFVLFWDHLRSIAVRARPARRWWAVNWSPSTLRLTTALWERKGDQTDIRLKLISRNSAGGLGGLHCVN